MKQEPPGRTLECIARRILTAAGICLALALPQAARSDRIPGRGDIAGPAMPDQDPPAVQRIDFRSALRCSLLVLPVSRATLDAAPTYHRDSQDRSVDAYWAAHPPLAAN